MLSKLCAAHHSHPRAFGLPGGRWRCLARLGQRCRLLLRLMDTLDLVGRTAELAR
jgi:hypothetical protein